jgi:hypothetical protein
VLDGPNLKKRDSSTCSWNRVEATTAFVQTLDLHDAALRAPHADLHLLDPLFVYPSTVLGRERAIIVNLE